MSVVHGRRSLTGGPFDTAISAGGGSARKSVDNPDDYAAVYGPDLGYDYEFQGSGSSLPPDWTLINSPTYQEDLGVGLLTVPTKSGTYDWRMMTEPISGSSWDVRMKLVGAAAQVNGQYYSGALIARDSSNGKLITLTPYPATPTIYVNEWTDEHTHNTQIAVKDVHSTMGRDTCRYLRLRKNSPTSYDWFASPDGVGWITIVAGVDPSAFLTIDEIGFGATQDSGQDSFVAAYWVRVR